MSQEALQVACPPEGVLNAMRNVADISSRMAESIRDAMYIRSVLVRKNAVISGIVTAQSMECLRSDCAKCAGGDGICAGWLDGVIDTFCANFALQGLVLLHAGHAQVHDWYFLSDHGFGDVVKIMGASPSAIGSPQWIRREPPALDILPTPISSMQILAEGGSHDGVRVAALFDEAPTQDDADAVSSILSVLAMAISQSIKMDRLISDLHRYAMQDHLTGVWNRRHFDGLIHHAIVLAEACQRELSVLLVDLDDFKSINDTYGHSAGDQALIYTARTLEKTVGQKGVVARLGGDEFVVLLKDIGAAKAKKIAQRLQSALSKGRLQSDDGRSFSVSLSLGLAVYPRDGATIGDLLSSVDVAMYSAKAIGKNALAISDGATKHSRIHVRETAERARIALRNKRIAPWYQPLVDPYGEPHVVGQEVLARWIPKDESSPISAGKFIKSIEEYGMTEELGRAILSAAIATYAKGEYSGFVFFNLSPREMTHGGLIKYAETLCKANGVDPSRIVFEMTERAVSQDEKRLARMMRRYREKGFRFALDDFGSGYNSIRHLELPFDIVKFDGHSVTPSSACILKHTINMCRELNIQTVMEFIDSKEAMHEAMNLGITYLQGHLFGAATPLPVFTIK